MDRASRGQYAPTSSRPRLIGASLLCLAVLLLAAGYFVVSAASLLSEDMPPPSGAVRVMVLRVVDGDTIVVQRFGKVRYIGVDTPETVHPAKPVQSYGREASAANRRLVEGRLVALEFDVQRQDKYGRTLAYVYAGRTFVNAALIEKGYAYASTWPPNVKYVALFRRLQQRARVAGSGLWSPPGKPGAPPPSLLAPPKALGNPASTRVMGSAKSDKYHVPTCKWVKRIAAANLIVFENVEAAKAKGYVPCTDCDPSEH